jgi:ankyrin repeat protein
MLDIEDPIGEFIETACAPLDSGHATGTLERAEEVLARHPEVAQANLFCAAILGDDRTVRRFLAEDPAQATAKGGPRDWDALTYLCFSKYLRLEPGRTAGFVGAAEALIDAGASPNTGWFEKSHQPSPEWESALYGAAGVAHNTALTKLLVERGADPNDGEVTYHTPETYDNGVLEVLVRSGRLTPDSLATLLIRKADWHDYDGIRFLLDNGADPNARTHWRKTPLQASIIRDNALEIVELMLDHGGDPTLVAVSPDRPWDKAHGQSGIEIAARRGRGDLLDLFEKRGIPAKLDGVAGLIAACARDNAAEITAIRERSPRLVQQIVTDGAKLLAQFAGNGNDAGVRHLLDLGVGIDDLLEEGDGYFDVAKHSTALHVSAWRSRPNVVKLLIERGADVNAPDGRGRSPLALSVRACVDSYWRDRRTPESVKALLDAGASVSGVVFPSGYEEVDSLLASRLKSRKPNDH